MSSISNAVATVDGPDPLPNLPPSTGAGTEEKLAPSTGAGTEERLAPSTRAGTEEKLPPSTGVGTGGGAPQRSMLRVGEGRYRVVVAANERSRNPLWDLNLAGVDFTNYRRNPVVLYNHDDAQVPVGRTLEIGQDSTGSIAATFEFLPQDPFAERVKNAWDMGFLRAASIRWLPLETERGQGGRIVTTRADMLEWSIVAIPADPDSLRVAARSLGLPDNLFDAWRGPLDSGNGAAHPIPHPTPPAGPGGSLPQEAAEALASLGRSLTNLEQAPGRSVGEPPPAAPETLAAPLNELLHLVRDRRNR